MHLMLLWGCPGASENSKCINNKVNCQHLKSRSLQTNIISQSLKDACDCPKQVCAHLWAINPQIVSILIHSIHFHPLGGLPVNLPPTSIQILLGNLVDHIGDGPESKVSEGLVRDHTFAKSSVLTMTNTKTWFVKLRDFLFYFRQSRVGIHDNHYDLTVKNYTTFPIIEIFLMLLYNHVFVLVCFYGLGKILQKIVNCFLS